MCVSEPALVLAVDDGMARVEIRGVIRTVPLTVVTSSGASVAPGDFLLVQTGLAVATLDAREAAERILFLRQGVGYEGS
jgi:hydrogenase assembly chaperone HypC/HupF